MSESHQVSSTERELLDLCARPGMFTCGSSIEHVVSFILGFDAARTQGPLRGFREWLIVRGAIGGNQGWSAVALVIQDKVASPQEQVRTFAELLQEFFRYRREYGETKIHAEYARWLLRKPWYSGPLRAQTRR